MVEVDKVNGAFEQPTQVTIVVKEPAAKRQTVQRKRKEEVRG